MFCPLCQTEYREGFTQCSDCRTTLVPSLQDESVTAEPVEVLIHVFDQAFFTEAVEVLRDAGVPHYAFEGLSGSIYSMREPEFKILVLHSDRDRADHLLREHFGTDEVGRGDLELPTTDEFEPPDSATLPEKLIPEDWDPEEATTKIWSGEDERLATMLRDCCRENAIPSRTVFNDPGKSYIYVRPQDETRTREILREITQGTPLT